MADYRDYFNSRLAQEVDSVGFDSKPSKYEELQEASKQKAADLSKLAEQRRQLQENLAKANETSIVTKLGLDEKGAAAQAVNAAASLASGASRLAGNIAALPASLASEAETAALSQEDYDAYTQYTNGDRSPETLAKLNRVTKGDFTLGDVNRAMDGQFSGATVLQRIEQSNAQRESARAINSGFDISNRVNQTRRQAFSEELTQNFDSNWGNVTSGFESRDAKKLASGIAGLLTEAGKAAGNNPGAVAEYVIENLPQLAIGAAGNGGKAAMLAGNVGYAADAYQKGIEKFQKENNGALPSQEQREEMVLWAASLAAAEQLGDVSVLKGAGAAVDATKTARTGFKDALLGTGKSAVTEAATEGFQTYGEGQAGLKPATAKEIYEGATIGGLSGGAMAGGPGLAAAAVNAGGDLVEAAKSAEQKAEASVGTLVDEAIKTGDVSALVDPAKPSYAPHRAIGALIGNTQAATAPEQKEANLKKADEILATLVTAKEDAATALEQTTAAGLQKSIDTFQAKLDALDKADPANARMVEVLTAGLENFQQELEAVTADPKTAEATARSAQAQLSKAEREWKKAADAYGQLKNLVAPEVVEEAVPEAEVADLLAAADKDSTPDNESIAKVITMAMRSPESLAPAQALKLANNASNGLSEDQRNYLRVFSTARIAENEARDLDMVQGEVFFGSPAGTGTNKGIQQYRKEVAEAIDAGNAKRANTSLRGLQRFAVDHLEKAAVAQEAWEEGKGTQIVRTEAGNWEITQVRMKPEALKANGGLTINTPKLVEAIQKEAAALDAVAKELEQAVAIASKKGNGNVTNQPPKAPVSQAEPTVDPVPATEPVGSPSPVQGTAAGVGNGEGSGDVQPASVVEPVASASTTDVTAVDAVTEVTDVQSTEEVAETSTVDKESTDSNTAVEQPTEITTADAATESEDRTSDTASSTVLSAFSEEQADDTPYHLQNLIGKYWEQKAKAPGDAAARPLASVKDFYSALKAGATKVSDFLKEGDLTKEQEAAVKHFFGTAKNWMGQLQKNMPKKKAAEFRTDGMVQYLLTDGANGVDMDENTKLAIAYAAYSFLLDEAGKPAKLKDAAINSILGRDKDAYVSHHVRKEMQSVGSYSHLVYDQVGGRVVDALGLAPKSNASQEQLPKLRAELGIVAVMMLEQLGLVSRTVFPDQEMQALQLDGLSAAAASKIMKNRKEGNAFAYHTFIALARDADGGVSAGAQSIVQANKGTKSIVNKLFKVEGSVRFPSLEPINGVQKKASGSLMDVPADLRKVVKQNQANPRKVVKDMMAVASVFDEQEFAALAGVKDIDEAVTHVVNLGALEAKNDGLQRELALFMEYAGELAASEQGLDTPFFLEFDVWKQQRVGIKTNGVNPQASKIVRQMIGSPEWESTIRSSDEEGMTSFYLRVAEGLGEKTEKTTNDKQIDGIKQMLTQPVYADAITALRKIQNGETVSQSDKDAIKTGVAKGKENLHSLASLVAMARQQNAEAQAQDGEYEFTTQLMGEVDGVANGTMLNHALLGAGSSEAELIALLNQGGFFEDGSPYTQYNQYRGTMGNLDVYESTARDVYTSVQRLVGTSPEIAQKIAAVWNIAGNIFNEQTGSVTKEGRNLVKGALNPLAFGSSMDRVVEGMADTFVEAVYAGFEDLAKVGSTLSQEQLEAYVDQINALIPNPKFKVQKGHSLPWHMSRPLSPGAVQAIKDSFSETVGQATVDTVEVKFGAFINARNALNYVAQTTYSLHDAVYSGMRAAYVKTLAEKGELPTDKKGKVIGDLSTEQEAAFAAQLKGIEPIIQTAFSKQDGSSNSGLRAAKRNKKRNPDSVYEARVYFGKKQALGEGSVGTSGVSLVSEGPGVAMGSATTHSFDSWISHSVQAEMDVLNVHDALGAGVLGLKKAAQLLNQKTFEGLVEYSPAEEAYQALSNVVAGISDLVQGNALSQEALDNLQKVMFKVSKDMEAPKDSAMQSLLGYAKQAAYDANVMKLNVLSKITHVDQYAFEGGNYGVTDKDRALIAEKLGAQTTELSAQDQASLEVLKTLPKTVQVTVNKAQAQSAQAEGISFDEGNEFDVVNEAVASKPATSAFGTLGKPGIKADKDLEAFFKQNPEAKAERVIQGLFRKYSKDESLANREFNLTLLRMLGKVVSPDLTIRYITASTPADAVLDIPKGNSRGWYSVEGMAQEINVLSSEFVQSGLTPELLVHELVHAALLQKMRSGAAEAKPFIDNLTALMNRAKEYATTNGVFDQHKEAFENLDEFVTWGMTNQAFQNDVLTKFYMEPADGTKSMVAAMVDFIKNITGLLFSQFKGADGKALRQTNGKTENGMAILINDVTQLLAQSKATKPGMSATASMAAKIDAMSTMDLFHALDDGKLGRDFQEGVGNLLASVVQKLHGPFGAFLESFKGGQAVSPLDVWTKALDTGVAPFASKILGSGFNVGVQEAFAIEQVEATVRAALDGNEANTKFAYRELAALYLEARKKLSVEKFHNGDWATATQTEKDNAQALHDFVFALEKTQGDKMDHLSRFAALGLAHEGFNKLLKMDTEVQVGRIAKANGIVKKLEALFQNILEMFSQKVTKTYSGQPADAKLKQLVATLVDIEAKKRNRLAMEAVKAAQGPKTSIVDTATESVRSGINKVINSALVKNSPYRLVRGAGAAARIVNNDRVDQFMELVSNLRDKEMAGRPGILAGTFNTVRGPKATMEAMMRMAKGYEGRRKDAITAASKLANQAFGKVLSREQKASVTRVFLRTGLSALVDKVPMADLEKLLSDKAALTDAITKAENALAAFPQYQHYFKAQANALAFAKVARNAGVYTMMNAGNIARMLGTVHQDKLSQAEMQEVTPAIETLVALYALDYSPSVDRKAAAELLRDELQRADGGNGVEFVLKAHKNLEKEAKQRLFEGQDVLMMHGYTSEIYNPHVEVVVEFDANAQDLINRGYVKVGPVSHDAADPDTAPMSIFLLKDGGLSPYQSGALSITNKKSKGTNKHSGYMNTNTFEGAWNASLQADVMNAKQAEIADMFKPAPRKDLSKERGDSLAPVFNARGEIVNWRYLMSEKNKDSLLDRDNSFDSVLGAIAGSIYGKSTTQEQNSTVLETLKEVYDAEVATNPDSFIEVSAKSTDPEMKEIWNMLPAETKKTALRIFGPGGIRVRKDSLDLVFGYRKLSLATLFDKHDRNHLEQLFVSTVEGILVMYAHGKGMRGQKARDYAKRAAVMVTKSERMWQSLVQETKDIIVVKTGTVLAGNVWSNLSLLWLKGVSLKDMAHHHAVAMAGATSYMADSNELDRLRLLQKTGYVGTEEGGAKGIEDKIALLEDALARNPVKELIDAGLMPSIVEDVAAEEDPYSYKSLLVRKLESATKGVPEPLVKAAKAVYMSKDGALYKGLYRATQLSDFVARYTLYQHLISREKNPMSKEAALFEASETFVNYDLPMHRALQYTDDMGLTPFMKYFLNIQRVLQKTVRDNPARVLGMAALGNVMDLGPIVLSSAAVTRIGNNPIQGGAFKFFGTVDDLATINASMALIK